MIDSLAKHEKIKVMYVLTPIDFGGAERVSLNFLTNFNADILEIVPVLLLRPWEKGNSFEETIKQEGLNYHTIPVAKRPSKEGKDYFRVLRCLCLLFKLLYQNRIDIIHTHGYFADILGGICAKVMRIPHVATCHGFIQNDKKLQIYNRIDLRLLRYSKKVIAVSDSIKKQLIDAGVKKIKIDVIINSVALPKKRNTDEKLEWYLRKKYHLKENCFFIGSVGRLSQEKGLQHLLEAAVLLRKKPLSFQIIIVGDGPERQSLMDFARVNGLQREVVFTGFLENPGKLLPLFDVFALPSFTEGTPMALLEAMSYGIPPIASKVGGVPDVIESGVNGVLVESGKTTELAEAILKLYKDKEYRLKLSYEARNSIKEKYSLPVWVNSIESIYSELVN